MYAMIKHRVRDYDQWYPKFAEHENVRRQHGLTNVQVFRGANDKNEVLVTCEAPSRKNLKSFLADPSLEEAMKEGGVTGKPMIITGKKMPMPKQKRR